jgi:hypothetical protein
MAKIFGLKKLIAFGILKHESMSPEKAHALEKILAFLLEKVESATTKRKRATDETMSGVKAQKKKRKTCHS